MKEVMFAISRSYMVVVDQMPIMKIVHPRLIGRLEIKMEEMKITGAKHMISISKL